MSFILFVYNTKKMKREGLLWFLGRARIKKITPSWTRWGDVNMWCLYFLKGNIAIFYEIERVVEQELLLIAKRVDAWHALKLIDGVIGG